jgi:methionyl-tRNA formyltransferase
VAYGRILPDEYLAAPRRGCINVHFSLLPLYRGASPVNWAIVNGETETGVTTMFIEPALDTGPILLQRKTGIHDAETAEKLMERLSLIGADLLGDTLAQLDNIVPREQDDSRATFAPLLKKEDGLIDWTKTAAEIERQVRGFQIRAKWFQHTATIWLCSVVITHISTCLRFSLKQSGECQSAIFSTGHT